MRSERSKTAKPVRSSTLLWRAWPVSSPLRRRHCDDSGDEVQVRSGGKVHCHLFPVDMSSDHRRLRILPNSGCRHSLVLAKKYQVDDVAPLRGSFASDLSSLHRGLLQSMECEGKEH